MLNLIGSFQFQDHTTLCKNRNPPTQRPWHSIETTRNKQEKNQLGERQNENTNMDLKKKKKQPHKYMHSKSILSQQWIFLLFFFLIV